MELQKKKKKKKKTVKQNQLSTVWFMSQACLYTRFLISQYLSTERDLFILAFKYAYFNVNNTIPHSIHLENIYLLFY